MRNIWFWIKFVSMAAIPALMLAGLACGFLAPFITAFMEDPILFLARMTCGTAMAIGFLGSFTDYKKHPLRFSGYCSLFTASVLIFFFALQAPQELQ